MSDPADLAARLQRLQAENQQLREQLRERDAQVYRLLQWLSQLQRDIRDVYQSFTWRIGDKITKLILKLLRRPVGPTAQTHVERLNQNIATWQQQYLQAYREQDKLMPYVPWHDSSEYVRWIAQFDPLDAVSIEALRQTQEDWKQQFCLLLAVTDKDDKGQVQKTLASVMQQIYPHWTLLLIAPPALLDGLSTLYGERILPFACAPHAPLAERWNAAARHFPADLLLRLQPGDKLHPAALHYFAQTARQQPQARLIYSDEDVLDARGERSDPYFKPDWSPDLFFAQDYLHLSLVYTHSAFQAVGGFSAAYPGFENYDLSLRLLAQQMGTEQIVHIPRVLYHAQPQTRNPAVQQAAVQAYFQRQQPEVQVTQTRTGHLRVQYPLPEKPPPVSVIIPTRDKLELLMGTVEGLLYHTDYPDLQIIILDNGSQAPETLAYLQTMDAQHPCFQVIRHDAPFNYSQLNNLGVKQATSEVLALLNNDLKMMHKDWLREMVSQALRREIGAVGAKLYYQDDTLQHAGVVTGLGGLAGHAFKHVLREMPAYQWRPFLTHNLGAVTAACLVLRKSVFEAAGGFDEKLKVAFNDVDLCLRIRQLGYRILWTPYAELYHLESASRGADDTPRKYRQLQKEIAYMRQRWGDYLQHDPYYNPNLSIQYEDYSLAWPPRDI